MTEHTEYTAHIKAKVFIQPNWGKPGLSIDHAMATLDAGKDDRKTQHVSDTPAWRRNGNWRRVNTERTNTGARTKVTPLPSRGNWRGLPTSSQRSHTTTSRTKGIKTPNAASRPTYEIKINSNKKNLASLSLDIWILILTFIPPSTKKHILPSPPPNSRSTSIPMLLSLIHVSRDLYTTLLPLLYHTVNLTPAKTSDATLAYRHRSLTCLAQWKFLRSVLARPELGQWVRELSWATGLENSKGFVPETIGTTIVRWREEDVWTVFGTMKNSVRVNVEGEQNQSRSGKGSDLRDNEPVSLFPSAQHVNLFGSLPHSLFEAILQSKDTVPLYSLTLDQLQDSTPPPFKYLETRLSSKPNPAERPPHMPRSIYAPPTAPTEPEVRDLPDVLTKGIYERCERLNELSITIPRHPSISPAEPEAVRSDKGKGKATQSSRDQTQEQETPIDIFYSELVSFLSTVPVQNVSITLPSSSESRRLGCQSCLREPGGPDKCAYRSERHRFPGWPDVSSNTPLSPDEVKIRDVLIPALIQGWKGKSVTVKGVRWDAVCAIATLRTRDKQEGGIVRVVCDSEPWDEDADADDEIVCAKGGNGFDAASSVEREWNQEVRFIARLRKRREDIVRRANAPRPDVRIRLLDLVGEESSDVSGVVGEGEGEGRRQTDE